MGMVCENDTKGRGDVVVRVGGGGGAHTALSIQLSNRCCTMQMANQSISCNLMF
jgi:hypothetical protein